MHNVIALVKELGKSCSLWTQLSLANHRCLSLIFLKESNWLYTGKASSETQGQLVGTTGFSWAKVYNKSGRAPGHLLLPNEFQKRLKSHLLIGQKNFFLANQRRGTAGRLSCLLTRGFFLINCRSSVARSTGTFLRRVSEKKINTKYEVEEIANYNVAGRKQTLSGIFHGGLIEGIINL